MRVKIRKFYLKKTQTYFILLVKGWMITRNLFAHNSNCKLK